MPSRLGYKKILEAGKDIEVMDSVGAATLTKKIVRSDSIETITKGVRQNRTIGVLPKNASLSGKALDAVKENGKLVLIPLSEATCAQGPDRAHALPRFRKLVRNVLIAKVPFALVSMAETREGMMSSLQMIEVAGFLGVDQRRAKEALAKLGEVL